MAVLLSNNNDHLKKPLPLPQKQPQKPQLCPNFNESMKITARLLENKTKSNERIDEEVALVHSAGGMHRLLSALTHIWNKCAWRS